jgi:molybdopterin-guanine dinucleotide biosynthesis protein A
MPKTAAILVGGRAHRLGGLDKSRLDVGGRTILDHQLDALAGVVDRIVLIGTTAAPPARPGVEVAADIRPGCGSLGGLYTALRVAAGPVVVVACDMPFLTGAFLAFLRDALGSHDAAIPRTPDGLHPLCAVYAQACLGPVERRLDTGRLKVVDALAGLHVREIGPHEIEPFDPDGLLFMNLNTPDDLSRAVARAGRSGA